MDYMQVEQYIESRRVSQDFAQYLRAFPPAPLEELLEVLQPSANALKSIVQLIEEVARRSGATIAEICAKPELQDVLQQESLARKERAKRYREVLEQWRYPEVARVKAQLADALDELRKDCQIRLELPKDLEGDSLGVSVSARSVEELAALGNRLIAAAAHPATARIYKILQGGYE